MPFEIEKDGKTIKVYTEEELQSAVADEVKGLKVTNQNLKDEKKELAEKLKAVDDEKRKAEEEKAKRDGDYEKLERLMEERLESERQESQKLIKQIRGEKVGSAINDLVTKLGAGGQKNEDLRDLLKSRFEFDYDNESGKVTVAGDGISSLDQLEKAITESGRYDAYLAGPRSSGGGAPGGQGGGAALKFSDMTEKQRTDLYRENPDEYRRLRDAEKTA